MIASWVAVIGIGLLILFIFFGLDDLFIDIYAALNKLGPVRLSPQKFRSMMSANEKPIAIVIPAWMEGEIIDTMVRGNLSRIQYSNYHLFIGIYPNDPLSIKKLARLERKFPRVHAVIGSKPGPTSKGQILNEVFRAVFTIEKQLGISFDGFLMQDAEDLIHPLAVKLINQRLAEADYIQIPVFSLAHTQAKRLPIGYWNFWGLIWRHRLSFSILLSKFNLHSMNLAIVQDCNFG